MKKRVKQVKQSISRNFMTSTIQVILGVITVAIMVTYAVVSFYFSQNLDNILTISRYLGHLKPRISDIHSDIRTFTIGKKYESQYKFDNFPPKETLSDLRARINEFGEFENEFINKNFIFYSSNLDGLIQDYFSGDVCSKFDEIVESESRRLNINKNDFVSILISKESNKNADSNIVDSTDFHKISERGAFQEEEGDRRRRDTLRDSTKRGEIEVDVSFSHHSTSSSSDDDTSRDQIASPSYYSNSRLQLFTILKEKCPNLIGKSLKGGKNIIFFSKLVF